LRTESETSLALAMRPARQLLTPANLALAVGAVALIAPTMFQVARDSWSTEQGGHGPLVLVTGLWALWRERRPDGVEKKPGNPVVSALLLGITLSIFAVARITGVLEIEAFAMYGAALSAAYLVFGSAVLRSVWFPLVYLAFTLPPPDTVVEMLVLGVAVRGAALNIVAMPISRRHRNENAASTARS